MKNNISLTLLLLSCLCCLAQGSVEVSFHILTNKGAPMSNATIKLYEPAINETVNIVTNSTGTATTTLEIGVEWQMFINGFQTGRLIKVPESGKAIHSVTETYNPEEHIRTAKQTMDRTNLTPIVQDYPDEVPPRKGNSCVEIKVVTRTGQTQSNVIVYLLNIVDRTYYQTISNHKGIARFIVPSYASFDVDIESYLNAGYLDLPKRDAIIFTYTIIYDKPDIDERISGDSIFQDLKGEKPVASGRSFYTLTINKGGFPAIKERVYIKEINGSKIFCVKTDVNGKVEVLLPFGKRFMVNFDFQPDVDVIDLTHSYGQSSGYITLKYIPDPRLEHPELFIPDSSSLFLVDFENFLKKQYPKPSPPKKVAIFAKFLGKVNANSKEAVMEIGYTARGTEKRTPLNICFVLDISGSMAGYYRLERLKSALAGLISKIDADAIISIVAFESNMKIVFAPQKLGMDKSRVIKLINELEAGGGTNMLEALKKGYGFVSQNLILKGNNSVILLTDGYDENEVQVLLDVQKPFNSQIVCTTIGVGTGYNYALLDQLASNSKGRLHFVGESEEFNELFSTKLFTLLRPVATDVTLEIEYNNKMVFKHLYGPKPANVKSKWPRYQLPNLYSGSNNIALAKFDLIKPDKSIEAEAVIIRISFMDDETGKKVIEEQKVYPEWEPYTGVPELIVEAEVKKLFCIAIINQGIKVMSDLYSAGQTTEAQKTLERTKVQVLTLYPKAGEKDVEDLMVSLDGYLEAFRNLAKKEALKKQK